MELEMIRESIDELDGMIINLLAKRQVMSLTAGKIKFQNGLQIIDKKREAKILARIMKLAKKNVVNEEYVKEIYAVILRNSRDIQQKEFQN